MFEIHKPNSEAAMSAPKARIDWPWKRMEIGDMVKINDANLLTKAQVNCHVYGRLTMKKFSTKKIDGVLHVWRLE